MRAQIFNTVCPKSLYTILMLAWRDGILVMFRFVAWVQDLMIEARIGTTFFCQLSRRSERKRRVLQDLSAVREEILFGTEKATDSEFE
jgi:hypothetical protein